MEFLYKTELLALYFNTQHIEIERIINIDELCNVIIDNAQTSEKILDEKMPYWAELWPSAMALSQFIATKENDFFQEKKVIEIGAGLGLPSIVTAKLFPSAIVTVSDYLVEAVDFSKKNGNRNQLNNINYKCFDWREINHDDSYDIILAADIAYDKEAFPYLVPTFKRLLSKNGMVLLSEPNRGFAQAFLKKLENDFMIERRVLPLSHFGRDYLINILELKTK